MTASVIDPVELVNATRLDHRNATGSCGLVAAWSVESQADGISLWANPAFRSPLRNWYGSIPD